MTFIDEKIRMTIGNLASAIITDTKNISDISYVRSGYKTSNLPPENAEWKEFCGKAFEFDADSHAWLHFTIDVPETSADEECFLRLTTGREGTWDSENPQCMIFVNGTTCEQALDTNHTEMPLTEGHKDIYIYFYGGTRSSVLFINVSVITKNTLVDKLYYDLSVPYNAMKCLDKNTYAYTEIINSLDAACLLLDFRDKGSKSFLDSVKAADDYLEKEFYSKKCGKDTVGEISLIGHTHIDVAWMWTLSQTIEKSQRSFSTVIKLMERYPEYIFMSSQPQLYAYVKESDPELYEKIKEKIREGRWETEGAMWLESDTNLVSGESLIRQIMYGKKFMKDEFGKDNHILWLPDVFGYSAALPQILKKTGCNRFFTSKISWCETDKFPHDNFIWQGIDGSEVFAVLSDAYVKRLEPSVIMSSEKNHVDKKYSTTHLSTFGFGDGGGGPTAGMLEQYNRLKRGLPGFPRVTMKRAADTIEEIHSQFEEASKHIRFTPKWVGELYLEMHRGTYTTMAENKKNNRRSELLYQKAETALCTAKLLAGADYPKAALDEGWITILRNQFHDIIPGSSIKEVYEDSREEYKKVLGNGETMFSGAIESLANSVKTSGGYFVYNPTSFEQSGLVGCDGKFFAVQNIPAHGYAVVKPSEVKANVSADKNHIENDFVKVTFDEKYNISSVLDKKNCREVIESGKSANVLEVYEDYPRSYDAWEITEYYKQKMWTADEVSIVKVINEDLYAGVVVTRKYGHSTIRQQIQLYYDSARIDFVTDIDWHEDHVLLKAAFPLDIRANHVNCEIQCGYVERPTHRNTSWDEAKFEISAHKWVDMSESDYGAAILNDCKYGYSTDENTLRISLLKAPTYPNPVADRGEHHFTYSLYPHKGALGESDVVKQAFALNSPMTVIPVEANANGKLPDTYSFVTSSKDSAVVDTAKLAEDTNGFVFRIYDAMNRKTNVRLDFGFEVEKAYVCDMLENNLEEIDSKNDSIETELANFEIKTLRVIAK